MIEGGADWIHFDVMDGQFVPPITFGDAMVASLRDLGETPFEAHLMTRTPERHFAAFQKAGCKRIIFHAEATNHAHRMIQILHDMGLEAGVAINPGTPAAALEPVIGNMDLALVMTVNPGWGGQSLIQSCLDKVKQVRQMSPTVHIEVDGGIDHTTLPIARKDGADTFVVGSWLAKQASVVEGMEALREVCQ